MLLALLLCLLPLCQALSCALYDFSRAQPSCASACSAPAIQVGNKCLMGWQYLVGDQVHTCSGAVSSDRTVCCRKGQFIQQSQCLPCSGQIYNNGQACCPSDSYLDYSTGSTLCSRLGSSSCPQLHFNSLFKICCPSGQYYNVATNICAGPAGLNCDLAMGACCPSGQYLEWADSEYLCLSSCSWRSSQVSNFQCEYKFCGQQGAAIVSSPSPAAGKLLSLGSGCCYGLDAGGNCMTADKSCLGGFANKGWSICCQSGQFYVVANGTCAQDCTGIILFNSVCLSQGQALDLRDVSGRPRECSLSSQCNGVSMSMGLPVCCPSGHYIADSLGCSYCNGNIFTLQGGQICCSRDSIFNANTGSCQFCDGVMDSAFTLCCPMGSYVKYDSAGTASCAEDCSLDNLYKTASCCDGLTQSCNTAYSATSCNPALLVPFACAGCPAFCSQNTQLCTSISSFSADSCSFSCTANQILVSGVGCLDCDASCVGCTTPISSAGCISCAVGYTQFGGSCQACALTCLTCSQFTDSCTSCYPRDVLVGTRCMRSCLAVGLYLDSSTQACLSCSSLCAECSSSSSSSCTSCAASQFLVQQPVSNCQACDMSCKTCYSSATTCVSCASNFYKYPDGTCSSYCGGAVYSVYVRGALCLPCHPSCNLCKGHPMNCESCHSDSTFLDDSWGVAICSPCISPCEKCLGLAQCLSCVKGFYLVGTTCSKCDSTCATCNGPSNSNCLSCSGTSTLSDLGFCSGCSAQCQVCEGNKCTSCISGYFIYNGICMDSCPLATYPVATTCKACDATCDACNATACLTCNAKYLYVIGSKCYSLCPANYSPSGKTCVPTAPPTPTPPTPTPTPTPTPNPSPNDQILNNSSGQMVQQKVVIRKGVAFVNLYFSTSQFQTDNLSVSLINKLTGVAIPLQPSGPIDRSDNRLYFSVAIPSDQDYSAYSLLQLSSTSKGTTSTLVSSQSSPQLLLQSLQDNAISNMKVLGYVFSAVILLMALLTKIKGHFTAERANNFILHSLNFAQVCYLFKYASPLDEGAYFFLNGFGVAHFSFFPNFFSSLIPQFYVQTPVEKTLVPDGNLLRNAGSTFSFQLIVVGLLAVGVVVSLYLWRLRDSTEPPFMRGIARVGLLLFHIGFMRELFFALVQLIQPHSSQQEYAAFAAANAGCSYMVLLLVPIIMGGAVYHFYATYNSDLLEHYYTLREAGLYLLIYAQAFVMCLAVGKPLMGLFLMGLEGAWLVFNYQLYRYGAAVELVGYSKYFGISGFICLAYLFLSLQQYVPWVLLVLSVSVAAIGLLVYCGYQLFGIYYFNIYPSQKDPEA